MNASLAQSRYRRQGGLALAFAAALMLGACASQPNDGADDALIAGYEEPNDPLEIPNRFFFAFNETLDVFILQPVAATYRFLLPVEIRDVVRNFVRHVSTPVVLANDAFQGEWERAEDTLARFVANSVTGGLGDLVEKRHPYHDEDFGQTLAVHGVDDGFYLVLPILGPSTARDGVGEIVDIFLDPITYVDGSTTFRLATRGAAAVDWRSRNIEAIEELKRDSVDYYARVRSLYYQRRQQQIENTDGEGPIGPGYSETDSDDQVSSSEN